MLLECPKCEALVHAKEVVSHEYQELYEGEPLPWESRDTFVVCPSCNEPMVAYEQRWDDGSGWEKPVRIYPPRDRQLHDSVPPAIRDAFTEARTCLRAKAFTAGAIMCRKRWKLFATLTT
jgi:hypothetical protein